MNNKQLSRIADALEKIAGNQVEFLAVVKASAAVGDQNLSTHGSMFTELREMIEPLLAGAAAKLETKASKAESSDPALPPQPLVIEKNGMRIVAAESKQIGVDVE